MQWLNELPFADNRVLQIGFLAACGIAALIVLAIFYRLTFAHRLRVPGGRTRQPRLGLVDAFSLDGQRQLVLVRRDNIEHLVMIGGPNDVLVESQINRAVAPARESSQASPLLVPATPVRRTEAAALAPSAAPEQPAKVAAKSRFAARSTPGCNAAGCAASAGSSWPPPAAPIAAPPIPKAPAPAQPTAPVPAQSSVACPNVRARAGASALRCAGAPQGSGRAGSTSAAIRRRASGGAASRTTACDDAPADHPRERLAEPWGPGSRHGNGSRERPGQSPGPVSCHAYAAAPAGESGAGSRWLESGADRRDGKTEPPAASTATAGASASAALAQARTAPKTVPCRAPRPTGREKRPRPARQATRRTPRRTASRRPKSTIPLPISICSRRRWRVCLAAKSPIDRDRRRCGVDSRREKASSIPLIAPTIFPWRKRR